MPADCIRIKPGFVALICSGIYFGSIKLCGIYLLAAFLHEFGHIISAGSMGLHIRALTLSAQGAELSLQEEHTSFLQDIVLCLAGPSVNLLCFLVCAAVGCCPVFAAVSLLLGIFNLLPVLPLDGGNALFALLSCLFSPAGSQWLISVLSIFCALLIAAAGGIIFCLPGGKPYLMLLGIWLVGGQLAGK